MSPAPSSRPDDARPVDSQRSAAPLGVGALSLGLSSVGGTADQVVARLVTDARAAVAAGFDGVTLSEHHGGFPGYVPDPVTTSAMLLERMDGGWACAAPAILPLRDPVLLAEQLAWSQAACPGRVGAAFVPGYQESDFALFDKDFEARHRQHWLHLERLVELIGPDGLDGALADDPAVQGLSGGGIPILTGAAGPIAVRRAAQLGTGVLIPSLRPPHEVRALVDRYDELGGRGPVVLIRRLHLGASASGSDVNRERWGSRAGAAPWLELDDEAVAVGEPEQVVESLVDAVRVSGCTALNLRLECYADAPDQVATQVGELGRHVLPQLRAELGW